MGVTLEEGCSMIGSSFIRALLMLLLRLLWLANESNEENYERIS